MNTQIILLLLLGAIGVMLGIIAVSLFSVKRSEDEILNVKMRRIFSLMRRISSLRSSIYRNETEHSVSQVKS